MEGAGEVDVGGGEALCPVSVGWGGGGGGSSVKGRPDQTEVGCCG